ncbi:hypothetical protein TNCV_2169461 [Trichonephila clavipes]|nr:hypothetical protein TNCV_2169461 [Trichonephila clavipes]
MASPTKGPTTKILLEVKWTLGLTYQQNKAEPPMASPTKGPTTKILLEVKVQVEFQGTNGERASYIPSATISRHFRPSLEESL